MESENIEEELIKKEKSSNIAKLLYIILINILNIILVVFIFEVNKDEITKSKIDKNENKITSNFSDDFLKHLNELAITEKRINHLYKNSNNNNYYFNDIILLEKIIIKTSWNFIDKHYKKIKEKLNKLISDFLLISYGNIADELFGIMIENKSNDNILCAIDKLKNEKNEIIKDKLNMVLLYSFINLPLQLCYFNSNSNIKNDFLNEIYSQMKLNYNDKDNILNKFNTEIGPCKNESIYIVLGANQEEEYKRITSKSPDIPYISICNTGLRTQYLQNEIKLYLIDNINNYYIKPELKPMMMQCTSNDIMTEEIYNNFINDLFDLIKNLNEENILKTFSNYSFSVETANSVIEYLKLGVSLDDIIIMRLGDKNTNKNVDKSIKYNKNKVYILFNVIDVSETMYIGSEKKFRIKRATTEANVKALYYLKNECKNFLGEEDYNNLVLVSSQGNGERQLEAFNIISNIFKYGLKFNYVIWSQKYEKKLEDKNLCDILTDIVVKSFNLIAKSLKEYYMIEYDNNNDEDIKLKNNFIEEMINLIKMLTYNI